MRGFYPGQAEGRRRRLHLLFLAALVLAKAGSALIRENVPDVATHLKDFHVPTLLPGITVTTSPTDYSVINRFQDPTVRERPLGSGRKDILGKRGSRPQSPSNCHSINSLLVPQELVHRKTPIAKAMMPRRGEQNEPPVMPPSSSLISFGRSRLTGGVAVSTWTPTVRSPGRSLHRPTCRCGCGFVRSIISLRPSKASPASNWVVALG